MMMMIESAMAVQFPAGANVCSSTTLPCNSLSLSLSHIQKRSFSFLYSFFHFLSCQTEDSVETLLSKKKKKGRTLTTTSSVDISMSVAWFILFILNLGNLRMELEMTFLCICCIVWLPRKWEKIEKKRKYFFIWIFNIIANVDVLMWNFLILRMETRESGKGNLRKCWGFHFNGILVILIIGQLGELRFTHNNWIGLDLG